MGIGKFSVVHYNIKSIQDGSCHKS